MKKYDWKITAKKFLYALGEILIAGTLVYVTDKPEFLLIVPVLEAIRNWWKHR